jgi:hypothetical protein
MVPENFVLGASSQELLPRRLGPAKRSKLAGVCGNMLSEKLLPNSSNLIRNFHFRSRYSSPLPQADIGTFRQSQVTEKQPICTTVYPYRMQGIRGGLSGLYSLRAFPWLSEGQVIQRLFSTTVMSPG